MPYTTLTKISGAFVPASDSPFVGQRWPYFPAVLDVRGDSSISLDYIVYVSGDHGTASGITAYFVRGDLADPANWLNRTAADAAGWLDWLGANKPTADVIVDAGNQMQTPHVVYDDDTQLYWLFAHVDTGAGLGTPLGQQTIMYSSPDAVNWTLYTVASATYLPFQEALHHSGYARVAKNRDAISGETLFPDIPERWVAYATFDEQGDDDVRGMWASDTLTPAGGWRLVGKWGRFTADADLPDFSPSGSYSLERLIGPGGFRRIDGKTLGFDISRVSPGDGTGGRYGRLVEAIYSDDGRRLRSQQVIEALAYGTAGIDDKSIDHGDIVWLTDTTGLLFYTANAISGGDIANLADNSIRGATITLNEPLHYSVDFTRETSLPSWLTATTGGGTSFSSEGLSLTSTGTNWAWLRLATPVDVSPYAACEIRARIKMSTTAARILQVNWSGLTPTASAPPTSMHRALAAFGTDGMLNLNNRISGVDQGAVETGVHVGYDSDELQAIHDVGHRLNFDADSQAVTIEGGKPVLSPAASGVIESITTNPLYAMIGFKNSSAGNDANALVIESLDVFFVHDVSDLTDDVRSNPAPSVFRSPVFG